MQEPAAISQAATVDAGQHDAPPREPSNSDALVPPLATTAQAAHEVTVPATEPKSVLEQNLARPIDMGDIFAASQVAALMPLGGPTPSKRPKPEDARSTVHRRRLDSGASTGGAASARTRMPPHPSRRTSPMKVDSYSRDLAVLRGDGSVLGGHDPAVAARRGKLLERRMNLTAAIQAAKQAEASKKITKVREADRTASLEADPSRSEISGDGLKTGMAKQLSTFTIVAKDKNGRRRQDGGDLFLVTARGASVTKVRLFDNGDGTYTCEFRPSVSGLYYISVSLHGVPLPSSPYAVEVLAPRAEATKCVVRGGALSCVSARVRSSFEVEFVDALGQVTHAEELDVFVLPREMDEGPPPPSEAELAEQARQAALIEAAAAAAAAEAAAAALEATVALEAAMPVHGRRGNGRRGGVNYVDTDQMARKGMSRPGGRGGGPPRLTKEARDLEPESAGRSTARRSSVAEPTAGKHDGSGLSGRSTGRNSGRASTASPAGQTDATASSTPLTSARHAASQGPDAQADDETGVLVSASGDRRSPSEAAGGTVGAGGEEAGTARTSSCENVPSPSDDSRTHGMVKQAAAAGDGPSGVAEQRSVGDAGTPSERGRNSANLRSSASSARSQRHPFGTLRTPHRSTSPAIGARRLAIDSVAEATAGPSGQTAAPTPPRPIVLKQDPTETPEKIVPPHPTHPRLDGGERQRHMRLWQKQLADEHNRLWTEEHIATLLRERSSANSDHDGAVAELKAALAGPSFANEIGNLDVGTSSPIGSPRKATVGFAYGGVYPGTIHAHGKLVKTHAIHYSVRRGFGTRSRHCSSTVIF